MNRSVSFPALRPDIPQAEVLPDTSPAEIFQNKVLRPILKVQHPILVRVVAHYLTQKKLSFTSLPDSGQRNLLAHVLQTDQRLIQLITGLVVALLTIEEYEVLLEQEKELMKRIRSLAIQRLQSDIPTILHLCTP